MSAPAHKLAAAVAALALAATPARGHELRLEPSEVAWKRLGYKASKLFLTARTEVRYKTVPSSRLDGVLIASPEDVAVEPAAAHTSVLSLETSFAGRHSKIDVWFDPGRAAAYQRAKLRAGKKGYSKTYRFTHGGVYSHRVSPRDHDEAHAGQEAWSEVHETFYPHTGANGCGPISEPTVIFHLLATAELADGGAPLRLCTFSDKALSRIEVRATGREPVAVDYVEVAASGERVERREDIEALRVEISARPVRDGEEGVDFEFLGLEGDVEMYLDPKTRIPVEIRGRLPGAGKVVVRLTEATLR